MTGAPDQDVAGLLARLSDLGARLTDGHAPGPVSRHLPARDLASWWRDDTPRVAVVGPVSTGKSTLVGRLLGIDWLPVARTATTGAATWFRHGPAEEAELRYRRRISIDLHAQRGRARTPDRDAIDALRAWVRSPADHHLEEVREIDARGNGRPVVSADLLADLDRIEAAAGTPASGTAAGPARRFEIVFAPREPETLDSGTERDRIVSHLTEPARALTIDRCTLFLPRPLLRLVTLIDTPGLSSPSPFHLEVTTGVLRQSPDVVLVLLDARRLDSPLHHRALAMLSELRFVAAPEDYRHVRFGLTFWESLVRARRVNEGREPEGLAGEKRDELARLLAAHVGVPCSEPVVFVLGRADDTRPLARHLQEIGAGGVTAEMRARRWRAVVAMIEALDELAREMRANLEEARRLVALDRRRLAGRLAGIRARRDQLLHTIAGSGTVLRQVVESRERLMLAEIAGLAGRGALRKYANGEDGYRRSVAAAVESLVGESVRQNDLVARCDQGRRRFQIGSIEVDARELALPSSTSEAVMRETGGFGWTARAVTGSLADGTIRAFGHHGLNDKPYERARQELRAQVGSAKRRLLVAVERWTASGRKVSQNAARRFGRLERQAQTELETAARRADDLERRLAAIDAFETDLSRVRGETGASHPVARSILNAIVLALRIAELYLERRRRRSPPS